MAFDERWVGRLVAASGMVVCLAAWAWVEDRTDEEFRRATGRHVELVGQGYRICGLVRMPAYPSPGTSGLLLRSRYDWRYEDPHPLWASPDGTRRYEAMRLEMCQPPRPVE